LPGAAAALAGLPGAAAEAFEAVAEWSGRPDSRWMFFLVSDP
jgi:hypothetical protein